jgi:hypothetical protein
MNDFVRLEVGLDPFSKFSNRRNIDSIVDISELQKPIGINHKKKANNKK